MQTTRRCLTSLDKNHQVHACFETACIYVVNRRLETLSCAQPYLCSHPIFLSSSPLPPQTIAPLFSLLCCLIFLIKKNKMSFACSQAFHTHYKLWALEYSTCTIYPGLNRSELGEGKQMCIHVRKVWLLQD